VKLNRVQASLIERRVKTIELRGPRGYDAGKKVKRRKRHLLADTQDLILKAKVHPADVMDRDGVMLFMEGAAERFPRLRHIWLGAGCNGTGKGKDWTPKTLEWTTKIVQHPPKPRYIWTPNGVEPDWEKIMAQLPPPSFHVLPEPLDRGTNLLLARSESTSEQGLRTTL